jgi:hypothetical protein
MEDFFDLTLNWYYDFLVLLQQPRGLCAAGGVCRPGSAFLTTIVLLSDDLDRLYELCLSCLVS